MRFLRRLLNSKHKVPNHALIKHMEARYNYGRKIHPVVQLKLKEAIRRRLLCEHGVKQKPRVRYKLRTVKTQYCGYLYVEWK